MMKTRLPITVVLMLATSIAFGQQVISGAVKDNTGAPLPGATVGVKGTNTISTTDIDGNFRLDALRDAPFTLLVSFVGYKAKEVQVFELDGVQLEIYLQNDNTLGEILVTARRRSESVQAVPIPMAVLTGDRAEEAGAFNINRVKEMMPTVQFYSSNPRNTALNIRGLGTTFGLTNDGIDPGVGFYIDGVYYARPAATALDFIDVERIEVLRGPQGTLFGKNTTSGAVNIATRKPEFTPAVRAELSYGNFGFVQAKTSVTGPLSESVAARISFSGTQRDGTIDNVATGKAVNDLNNLGVRGQFLWNLSSNTEILLAGDITRQRPDGYAQVIAGVVQTQRPDYRQFENIIADLGYTLPSRNPFDRVIDHDTPWRSHQDIGGVALNVDTQLGSGTLTSTTSWRFWKWDPSNDRDFTGLQALSRSEGTSRHHNWSQEVRWAGELSQRLSSVFGIFLLGQELNTDPFHTEESGQHQWRFSQSSTSELWATPGLFDGFGIRTVSRLYTFSGALFGQVDWTLGEHLHIMPGVRLNYDLKQVDFNRQTYGGLQTDDPELLALKQLIYTDQQFNTKTDDLNFSGQLTFSYRTKTINTFATVATSYKPVGLNLGGLPTLNGQPRLELAEIKPEYLQHYELGVKASPNARTSFDLTIFQTDVRDYQTLVLNAQLGVNRGYLANAERIRVQGIEVEGRARLNNNLQLNGALALTDGKYVSFKEAPVPLEETGGEPFKDVSGGRLPGISKWAASLGVDLESNQKRAFGSDGSWFIALETFYRSEFSSSPTPSRYLNVDGYALVNARAGYRATNGVSVFLWTRNALNTDYFEQLLPAAGNAGHYAAVLGDPRTFGVTLRYAY